MQFAIFLILLAISALLAMLCDTNDDFSRNAYNQWLSVLVPIRSRNGPFSFVWGRLLYGCLATRDRPFLPCCSTKSKGKKPAVSTMQASVEYIKSFSTWRRKKRKKRTPMDFYTVPKSFSTGPVPKRDQIFWRFGNQTRCGTNRPISIF